MSTLDIGRSGANARRCHKVSDSVTIVQKLWNYCNVLRDEGLSYQDYIEQLTFLLFLKMADEQTRVPFNRPAIVPGGLDWATLHRLDGDPLDLQYRHTLTELGKLREEQLVITGRRRIVLRDLESMRKVASQNR